MEPLPIFSTISDVTVYRSGALVRRSAELKRSNGKYPDYIFLNDLPACLQDDSIRVQISADNGLSAPIANDIKIELLVMKQPQTSTLDSKFNDTLKTYIIEQIELQELLETTSVALEQLGVVDIPERPTPEGATAVMPSPTTSILNLNKFIHERRNKLVEQKFELEQAILEKSEKIDHLKFTIQENSQVPEVLENELTKGIVVRLSQTGASADTAMVSIEYMVPGAQWFPAYSLHIDSTNEKGKLKMHALIAQATGENWSNITIKLSTALPQEWMELPKLRSKRIGRQQSGSSQKGWRPPPEGVDALFADYDYFQSEVSSSRKKISVTPSIAVNGSKIVEEEEMDDLMGNDDLSFDDAVFSKAEAAPCMAPEQKTQKKSLFNINLGGSAGGSKSKRKITTPSPQSMKVAKNDMEVVAIDPMAGQQELTFVNELMNFQRLYMQGPLSSNRGKLKISSQQQYVNVLPGMLKALNNAINKAGSLPESPSKCNSPNTIDSFDYTYVCDNPVEVPSKAKYISIPVCEQQVDVSIRHVVVPREAPEVFRVAKISNPLKNPLLAGPIDLYLNGDFFITGNLDVIAPHGKADLGLGVEESIKVARNTFFEEESEGLLKGKLLLKHKILIEIMNNLKCNIEIEVRERIPVKQTNDENIEIIMHKAKPDWEKYSASPPNVRGRYAWKLKMSAGEKCELQAKYDVEIASKNEIIGGNRREA